MKRATLLIAAVVSLGCASVRGNSDADLVDVARVGLSHIERWHGPLVLVAPTALPKHTRSLLASMRHTISAVPYSPDFILPESYFELSLLSVSGSSGSLSGWLGPSPRKKPGIITDACGTGYKLSLEKRPEGWVVASYSATNC